MIKTISLCSVLITQLVFSQWSNDIRLTFDPAGSRTSNNNARSLISSGSVLHLVWFDSRDATTPEIFYKRSSDYGTTWSQDFLLSTINNESIHPSINASGNNTHVVWHDLRDANYEIYYKYSPDAGLNWGQDIRLTNATGVSQFPCVAANTNFVHVVWNDNRNGNYEIYYKRSSDNGVTWGSDIRLTDNTANSLGANVSVFGNIVYVVWYDGRDGNDEIYFKRSSDNGANWSSDTRITNNAGNSINPCISISGLVINVVWQDNRDNNNEIYFKRSTDGGLSWPLSDTRLTDNSAASEFPVISADGIKLYVSWFDMRDGNREIYYKNSINGGINWSNDIRLTNDPATSFYPHIAVSDSSVHVVWSDNRIEGSNTEIYYKKNFGGNITSAINTATEIPFGFYLNQNYPNPFNPKTTIGFGLPHSSDVEISVYDMSGKLVANLLNSYLNPGSYEINFNASALSSGAYFYRIKAGDFTEVKKMVLIK
ncbi:MAG: T9SS type A sorting domain-containing protein [Ignavibacteria bacterium]|nr:T9SS type A sorting domain-containing protein [Ignavibacteria bacterium]